MDTTWVRWFRNRVKWCLHLYARRTGSDATLVARKVVSHHMIGIIIGEVNRQVGRVVLSSLSVSNIIGIADDSSQNHGNAGHSITARRYLVVVTLPRCQYSDGTSGNISSWWHCSWEYVCFKIFSVKIQEGGRGEYGLDLIITPKWRVQTVILASFWQVSFHGIINGFRETSCISGLGCHSCVFSDNPLCSTWGGIYNLILSLREAEVTN